MLYGRGEGTSHLPDFKVIDELLAHDDALRPHKTLVDYDAAMDELAELKRSNWPFTGFFWGMGGGEVSEEDTWFHALRPGAAAAARVAGGAPQANGGGR